MSGKKEITISPTTRIEGHGKVTIILDESGNVSDAYFYATEMRGFDYFLKSMEADRLPFIISRICGVCSTAHVLASVKAIENIYGVEITETARKLRELLLMGQIINNHSLVIFFLTLPDFWFSPEENPSKRNIFQIMREKPEIGKKAILLRNFGTQLIDLIGKREVHVVSVVPGGLINPLKERERDELLKLSKEAFTVAREAVSLGKELFEKKWHDFKKAGDYRTYYMALMRENFMEFYDGIVHVITPEGKVLSTFGSQDYMQNIEEKTFEWTYAKFAYLKSLGWPDGVVQVGPSARMNVADEISTEFASRELAEFKRKFVGPVHNTLLFDYARLIDLLYACEKAGELLNDDSLTRSDTRVKVEAKGGVGIGLVEAPRGTLAHEYSLTDDGMLKSMRLIIPTQVNNAAINLNLKDAAMEFIRYGEVKEGLLNRIEMVVRAYDPCIKCATRSVGVKLKVEIINQKSKLVKVFNS